MSQTVRFKVIYVRNIYVGLHITFPYTDFHCHLYKYADQDTDGGIRTSKRIRQPAYNKSVHKDYSFMLTFLEDSVPCRCYPS
jgi:hypothetical protein